MKNITEKNYPIYQAIVYKQLSKFNIFYDREDYFQEGMLALCQALQRYNPAYSDNLEAYLTIHVKWHLISCLRTAGKRQAQEAEICRHLQQQAYIYEEENHWYGIRDQQTRTIIKYLQQGYSKKVTAQTLELTEKQLANKLKKMKATDE